MGQTNGRLGIQLRGGLLAIAMPWFAMADVDDAEQDLASVPELPRAAIERYARTDLEQWHYLRTRENEEGVVVDRHDPTLPGEAHWQLVSIDGREPTEEERRDYDRERADHSKTDERARSDDVMRMVLPGSVRALDEIDGAQRYRYALRSPDGKKERVFRALQGEFLVEQGQWEPWVREVRIWNTGTLRPWLGVRIDEADLLFKFQVQEGWVLPARVEATWTGELLALKDIGETLRVTLTDFRQVTTQPELAANP